MTTETWSAPTYTVREGRATVWLTSYRWNLPTEAEAISMTDFAAKRDVPEATVKVMSTRRTPKGTWVITVRRSRE